MLQWNKSSWVLLYFFYFCLCYGPGNVLAYLRQPSRSVTTTTLHAGGQVPVVPYYLDKNRKDYQWMDIYNALGRDRILFVSRYLDDEACNQLVASMVWLNSQSSKDPITLYLNVPGAMIRPTMAVYDVMQKLTCPIVTINAGLTVGVSALLCAAGTSGKRFAFPNSRFLMAKAGLDDPIEGQAREIALQIQEVMKGNERAVRELARLCGQPEEKMARDLKRDFYLTATEAAAYGVVDQVLLPPQPMKLMRYRGADDDVVGFGHFAEVRRLMTGPDDVITPPPKDLDEMDDYAAKEMTKKAKSGRIDPRSLKNGGGANRFANSRCKPPGLNKPVVPKNNDEDNGGDDSDKKKNIFKNSGF